MNYYNHIGYAQNQILIQTNQWLVKIIVYYKHAIILNFINSFEAYKAELNEIKSLCDSLAMSLINFMH